MQTTESKEWIKRFLFTHIRATKPDGRPLYAYRIIDSKYAELLCLLRLVLTNQQNAPTLPKLFCLYAAETFRREHAEGPWTWETIFSPLKVPQPPLPRIYTWIEQGLIWWQRPKALLQNAAGRHFFLVSIVCEGGLPLRLLQRENTNLTQFFRTVLESYYRMGKGGYNAAKTNAEEHAQLLPKSLQQESVFYLTATLIEKIGELQPQIGVTDDPIKELDQNVPKWRWYLPLRLEDETAKLLLTGLVNFSVKLAGEASAKLRWRGQLHQTSSGWCVEKYLELPEHLTTGQLEQWTNKSRTNLPRWHLLLNTSAGKDAVARLTLFQGKDGTARYRREWLKLKRIALVDAAVAHTHRLSLYDGQNEYDVQISNDEPWGDIPWVFVARNAKEELEWLTEGTARTKSEKVWVVTPADITPNTITGSYEKLGYIKKLNRVVYSINGQVDFLTPQQDRYRVTCQADRDSEGTFVVEGKIVSQSLSQRPLYRGLPRIQNIDQDERQVHAQWRYQGSNAPWQDARIPTYGRVWLRLIDSNGAELCRRLLDVVPNNFRMEIQIGSGKKSGAIRLTGLEEARLQLSAHSPSGPTITANNGTVQILCPILSRVLPPPLSILLRWLGSEPIELNVPYPQRGAFFQLAGQALPNDDWVTLDRLGGLRLRIQDPAGGCRFNLKGEIHTDITVNNFSKGWSAPAGLQKSPTDNYQHFHDLLPPLIDGQLDITLFAWQDRITALLASTSDPEAQVRLVVETTNSEILAIIRISRFDAMLEPDKHQQLVCIPQTSLSRLGTGWETRVQLEMLPLWVPTSSPITLLPNLKQAGSWCVPDNLESGPWWIIGRDNDWARFRPLMWITNSYCSTDVENSYSALATAIRTLNDEQRKQTLNEILFALGKDQYHTDWPLLFYHLRLTEKFPPSSLDIVSLLITQSHTLAMALFKGYGEGYFELVWALSRKMPFLWMLMPVDVWLSAATAYFGCLKTALAESDSGEEIVFNLFQKFREQASTHRIYWGSLCDWLQTKVFPQRPLRNSELNMARFSREFVLQQIAQALPELQGRHAADEIWPQSSTIKDWQQHLESWTHSYLQPNPEYSLAVRCAPFIVAHFSLNGIIASERLIYEVRLLRRFDKDWFDKVYAIALTLQLTNR